MRPGTGDAGDILLSLSNEGFSGEIYNYNSEALHTGCIMFLETKHLSDVAKFLFHTFQGIILMLEAPLEDSWY